MTEKENKELESLINKLFLQSRNAPELSSKVRLKSILDRSLHELALRDLLVFSAHLMLAMLSLLPVFVNLFLSKTQRDNS
jgi:hypothetical protein